MRRLYTLLLYLALPFALLAVARRAWRERQRAAGGSGGSPSPAFGWRERFGWSAGGPVHMWVHAASVGEVQVAATLIGALRTHEPQLVVVLTCATPSGRARARALLPQITVGYMPFDLPGAVRRTLRRLRPELLILVETELWPNLLHECARAEVHTLIASARVSARSARCYQRLPGLLGAAMRSNLWVGAQTQADAQRFRDLGVPGERVRVVGNIKFDRQLPADLPARGVAQRERYGSHRALWVAGSAHPAETPVVLAAHRRLLDRLPQALLVLAPRHLHRIEETLSALDGAGLSYARRSAEDRSGTAVPPGAGTQVLLLDTLGELMEFYAASDVAFVGGSLIAVGGHNLLEPAALGLPVLTGPQHFNSPDIAALLTQQQALTTVADAEQLAAKLTELLTNAELRARQGQRACAALELHRGALQRLLGLMAQARRSGQEP